MPDVTIRDELPAVVAALPHRGPHAGIGTTFAELDRRLVAGGAPPCGRYLPGPADAPAAALRAEL